MQGQHFLTEPTTLRPTDRIRLHCKFAGAEQTASGGDGPRRDRPEAATTNAIEATLEQNFRHYAHTPRADLARTFAVSRARVTQVLSALDVPEWVRTTTSPGSSRA